MNLKTCVSKRNFIASAGHPNAVRLVGIVFVTPAVGHKLRAKWSRVLYLSYCSAIGLMAVCSGSPNLQCGKLGNLFTVAVCRAAIGSAAIGWIAAKIVTPCHYSLE